MHMFSSKHKAGPGAEQEAHGEGKSPEDLDTGIGWTEGQCLLLRRSTNMHVFLDLDYCVCVFTSELQFWSRETGFAYLSF